MKKNALIILFIIFIFILSGCWNDIHKAAKRGDVEAVRKFIAEGQDVNAINKKGKPVLWMAVRGGNVEVVRLLLDAGANPSLQDPLVGTSLHLAAASGRIDITKLLLDHGANINELSDRLNEPPIFQAVRRRHADEVTLLLERGADPNHVWATGDTILHMAVGMGNKEIVKILLNAGMDVNASDNDGRTPLYAAASGFMLEEFGFEHSDVITMLVTHGADLYHRDKNGDTPLEYAREGEFELKEAIKILERLQEKYPSPTMGIRGDEE